MAEVNILSFLTFNIRGISQNLTTLTHILSSTSLHVLGLQEINFRGDIDDLAIPGFLLYSLPSFILNGIPHRGLATYVRADLSCTLIQTFDLPFLQSQTFLLRLGNKQLTFTNLYIPPSLTVVNFPDLHLAMLLSHPAPCLLMGDFNCHHPLWNGRIHHGGSTLLALTQVFNQEIVFPTEPTFLPAASILDLFIIKGFTNLRIQVLHEGISDHWNTGIFIHCQNPLIQEYMSRFIKWSLQFPHY